MAAGEIDQESESEARARARLGTTVDGKWHLDSLLGVGGMAAVYAATHRNGTRGAIKILNPEIALNANAKSRFLREGYVANTIGHANVVQVLDDDEAPDGTVYLVMPLLDGETLQASIAAERKLSEREVLDITCQILDALEAAHERGIIHRDLKPANLFLTREGAVKLLDFGIAKLRESTTAAGIPNVTTLAALGTPGFMPPEQARGRLDTIDARVDIWALGATMFSLLTCRYVHEETTANEQLLAAMTKPAPSLKSVAPEASDDIAAIVDRALAFDREERFCDAKTMKEAAIAALRTRGGETRRPSGSPSARVVIRSDNPPDAAAAHALSEAPTLSAPTTDEPSVSDVTSMPPRRRSIAVAAAIAAALAVSASVALQSPSTPAAPNVPSAVASPTELERPAAPPTASGRPSIERAVVADAGAAPVASSSMKPVVPKVGPPPPSPAPRGLASSSPSSVQSAAGAAPPPSVDIFNKRH